MKLSIILPCYNVARYLTRCFESILSQKVYFDYEIIAVNDASTDNTLDILQRYAIENPNVHIINKNENGKLTGARTSGIYNASGEYIMHIDPDDYLFPGVLSKIFQENDIDFDLKIFNINIEDKDKRMQLLYSEKLPRLFDLSKQNDAQLFFKTFFGGCYAKIIRRSLLNDLYYYHFHYNYGEDIAFNFEVFNRSKVVIYDPLSIYCYCFNTQSLIRSEFNTDRLNVKQSWITNIKEILYNQVPIYQPSEYYIKRVAERYTVGLLLQITRIKPKEKRLEVLNKWYDFMYFYLDTFHSYKNYLYKLTIKIPNKTLSSVIILLLLGQLSPYMEKIRPWFKMTRF